MIPRAEILNGRIVLHFVDGEQGDGDLSVNEEVQDPGAPAFAVPGVVPASLEVDGSFGGSTVKAVPQTLANTFVAMAVLNPNKNKNQISLSLVDSSGTAVAKIDLQEPLPAMGQTAFFTRDVTGSIQSAVSIVARGREGPIQSLFLIGDNSQRRLDGVAGEFKAPTELDFPIPRQGSEASTVLFVFNPDIEESPEVAFQLFNQNGEPIKEVSLRISGNGFVARTLKDLFGNAAVVKNGYVRVRSDVPLTGFEFLAGLDHFSALAAQTGEQTRRLLVPHFFADNQGGTTEIRLLNRDVRAGIAITLKAFDDASNLLAMRKFEVAPGALFVGDIKEFLNLNSAGLQQTEAITGYLELELLPLSKLARLFGGSANVSGVVSFVGNEGRFRSTLPIVKSGRTETHFLQVAQSDEIGMFTGLAILNPTSETATVSLRAFDAQGSQTAETTLELAAGNRVVDVLDGEKFFGSKFSQVGGHLSVSSSVPVVSLGLFGDFKLEFLSAVEAQTGIP